MTRARFSSVQPSIHAPALINDMHRFEAIIGAQHRVVAGGKMSLPMGRQIGIRASRSTTIESAQ